MASVKLSPIGNLPQYFDNAGAPLAGGFIFTYLAGSTSNLALTYTSTDGDVPNQNPMELDSAGRPAAAFWLVDGVTYNFVLTMPDETTVLWSEDNITGTVSSGGGGTVNFPLNRSQYSDDTNHNIAWTNGGVPSDRDTRIRGVFGKNDFCEQGPEIMLLEAYLSSQWKNALVVNYVQDFCLGDYPSVTIPHLVVSDSVSLPGGFVNSVSEGSGIYISNTTGNVQVNVNSPQKSRVSTTGAISTVETYISVALAQQVLAAGDTYKITVYGTTTSSGANTTSLKVKVGSGGSTSDATIFTGALVAATSGTNVPWKAEFFITIRTTGTSGTLVTVGSLMNDGTTGIYTLPNKVFAPATGSINTTAGNQFGISLVSTSANTASTVYSVVAEMIH